MGLVVGGDAAAFELIYERHADVAFSLAYRMCGKRLPAEDVVQEAFVSLWRSAPSYQRSRGSVRSWVLRIVHNRAIDALRRPVGRDLLDTEEGMIERVPGGEHVEGEVERREAAGAVRGALGDLPVEQRRVIELAYFSGFTHVEIAELLELPVGTVKGRMRLALSKLRSTLGEQESEQGAGW